MIPEDLRRAVEQRDFSIYGSIGPAFALPLTADEIADGLELAGARRQLAEELRAEAMTEVDEWIEVAIDAGMPIAQIARLAGISRETIYARRR